MLLNLSTDILFKWFLALAVLTLVGFIASRWILPTVLRALVSNFRFRSISPRSIRGLFVKAGRVTIQLDRVGISFHSPTDASTRHIHIQVQGLLVKIAKPHPSTSHSSARKTAPGHRRSQLSLATFNVAPPLAAMARVLPLGFIRLLDALLRPVLRRCFVAAARTLIRLLPSLTQMVDVELDNAVVVFEELEGAHISISGVTLAGKANFTQLGDITARQNEEAKADARLAEEKEKLERKGTSWGGRFTQSSQRVWSRAWSITTGSTSVSLRVDSIQISNNSWAEIRPRPRTISGSTIFPSRPTTPSAKSFRSIPRMPSTDSLTPGVGLRLSAPATFNVSINFSTTALESESLVVLLDIPVLGLSSRPLLQLMERIERTRQTPEPVMSPPPEIEVTEAPLSPPPSGWSIRSFKESFKRQVCLLFIILIEHQIHPTSNVRTGNIIEQRWNLCINCISENLTNPSRRLPPSL